jgi:iron complex outermembrane recepter protein
MLPVHRRSMLPVHRRSALRVAVQSILGAASTAITLSAIAQQAPAPSTGSTPLEEVVVTGFRQSLNEALDAKRESVGSIDSIVAEDIADFPDLNLAESIQRVAGVSIARDAGEGRQISVRGLGPQFTRVRINGMEALTTAGGTDAQGGTNRDRSFDFNIFASELFNAITIRKTAAAEVPEGSLGATVDLEVARPFDYPGFTFVTAAQGAYNDLSEKTNPRVSALVSDRFFDDKLGALLSVAYTKRELRDEGSSTVRWQTGGTAATNFGPLGAGYDVANSPTLAQINAAFRPRIPRYDKYSHDQERLGVTASLQFRPTEVTDISLDALYSKFDAEREELFLEAPVFSTNGAAGINDVNPLAAFIDRNNSLTFGRFDDVDIRSEARFDKLSTEFTQLTLRAKHQFTDALRVSGVVGMAESKHDNPIQTTLLFDANNVDGYSYDFRRSSRLPLITYGTADVTSAATWTLSQIRLRPQTNDNEFVTAAADVGYTFSDVFTLKGGIDWREYEFETTERRRSNGTAANLEGVIPASIASTPIANYSRLTTFGSGLDLPAGSATRWLVPDVGTAARLFGLHDESIFPLGIEPSIGNNRGVKEEDSGVYVQLDVNTELFGLPLRGNVGVRYVKTDLTAQGFQTRTGATGFVLTTTNHNYSDTLPSLNLALNVTDDFIVRFGAAKTMTRPGLGNLTPGGSVSISGNIKTVTAGNPELKPFRADVYDASFEWYFAQESLVSLALFYKDIGTFVQTVRATGQDFSANPLGLPDSVALAACGPGADPVACLSGWDFNVPANTPGGPLKGLEVSYQQPFTFLPSVFGNFGTVLNVTLVESEVKYVDQTGAVVTRDDLTGLSETAYNATLYYDDGTFSARISAAFRDEYLTTVPGRNGNDVEGTTETFNLDFASSWKINDNFEVSFEALNLTDEFQDQWVGRAADRLSYYHHTGREFVLGGRYRF